MIKEIIKRDGQEVSYDLNEITQIIWKTYQSLNTEMEMTLEDAEEISGMVDKSLNELYTKPTVDEIQDTIENVLMNHHLGKKLLKPFILYMEEQKFNRENDHDIIEKTISMLKRHKDEIISDINNSTRSVNAVNNYIREIIVENYWLESIYPDKIANAHKDGDFFIHDLGFLGSYCAGWDCRTILLNGFGCISGENNFGPPKHLRSFLGQIINSTFATQSETSGPQTWSSIDTYAAPFIRYDRMSYQEVKQAIQEYVSNMNAPAKDNFSYPATNLTHDLKVPYTLKDEHVIYGGKYMKETYGEFQYEMDIFNKAFCEVMLEGDSQGRVFPFNIPTVNITKDFDWESESATSFMKLACVYGIPYFANFINSDLVYQDMVSPNTNPKFNMDELQRRGTGLFGSNPLTGSIGVVTINMPRLAYRSADINEFLTLLGEQMNIAKDILETKRKVVEHYTDMGFFPYCAHYLHNVKEETGYYWDNYFSTIGLVGQNEACLNLLGTDIGTLDGQNFSIIVLDYMRSKLIDFQQETGHLYNLEASPSDYISYTFAKKDKERYADILTSGTNVPYYTNSTQLPVGYTDDIFITVKHQNTLQSMYTGGTVLHLYLGEPIEHVESAKKLIKRIFEHNKLPYLSLTPTFSICPTHGYIGGEHEYCPKDGQECEVWSRVSGYLRPKSLYSEVKKEETKERKLFILPNVN